MNGFKSCLFLLIVLLTACSSRKVRDNKDGQAVYLNYTTPFRSGRMISLWRSPQDLLANNLASSDRFFIENLNPNTLIFQINRESYIINFAYKNVGRDLNLVLRSRVRGSASSIEGLFILVPRGQTERVEVTLDGQVILISEIKANY